MLLEELRAVADELDHTPTVDEGDVPVEIVKQRYGAFSDLEPVDADEETYAADDHDLVAGER